MELIVTSTVTGSTVITGSSGFPSCVTICPAELR